MLVIRGHGMVCHTTSIMSCHRAMSYSGYSKPNGPFQGHPCSTAIIFETFLVKYRENILPIIIFADFLDRQNRQKILLGKNFRPYSTSKVYQCIQEQSSFPGYNIFPRFDIRVQKKSYNFCTFD